MAAQKWSSNTNYNVGNFWVARGKWLAVWRRSELRTWCWGPPSCGRPPPWPPGRSRRGPQCPRSPPRTASSCIWNVPGNNYWDILRYSFRLPRRGSGVKLWLLEGGMWVMMTIGDTPHKDGHHRWHLVLDAGGELHSELRLQRLKKLVSGSRQQFHNVDEVRQKVGIKY